MLQQFTQKQFRKSTVLNTNTFLPDQDKRVHHLHLGRHLPMDYPEKHASALPSSTNRPLLLLSQVVPQNCKNDELKN